MFTISKLTGLSGALATICNSITSTRDEGTTIQHRDAWSLDFSQDIVEAPDFGTSGFTEKFQGLRDMSGSLGGFYDATDTAGQRALFDAWDSGSELGLKLWTDNSHYAYVEALITGPAMDIPTDDMITNSVDFEVTKREFGGTTIVDTLFD